MRLQLALDVADIDAAVDFYERLFDTTVAKRKPGYANFAIEQPPLKLVLFEHPDADQRPGVNHLGVEVMSAHEVDTAAARLAEAGLDPTTVVEERCCHADKVETWVNGPDGSRWEVYVKTADVDEEPGPDGEVPLVRVDVGSPDDGVTSGSTAEAGGGCTGTTCCAA